MTEKQLSRREVLSGSFLRGLMKGVLPTLSPNLSAAETFSKAARTIPVHRPPGAVAEARFLSDCTRCGDCQSACPHQAITLASERLRAAAGTPIIDPVESPCMVCPDTPCITACEPDVLTRVLGSPFPIMATARIIPHDCLAHLGSTCFSCSERCPVPGALNVVDGKPVIDAAICVGCGICAHVCPAPRPAIAMLPRLDRV